jgi:hypothetical protein
MLRFNGLIMIWLLALAMPLGAGAQERLLTLKQLEAQFAGENLQPTAKVLKKELLNSCYGCHIQTKDYEAAFLHQFGDFSKVGVVNRYAGVGTVNSSVLYNQVEINRMPTQGHLPLAQKTALLKSIQAWIEAGSPLLENVTPQKAKDESYLIRVIAKDLALLKGKASTTRYISLVHLYNNPETQVRLPKIREAVFKLVNSLSWQGKLVRPTILDQAGLVLRIDLADYSWTVDQWKSIERAYPYILDHWQLGGTDRQVMTNLVQATGTVTPIVRADWMVSQVSIPPLYNVFISLPETAAQLETHLGINVAENVASASNVIRWAFASSGVSQHNRMIERHNIGQGGYYWKSYDFDGDEGDKDVRKNPLGIGAVKTSGKDAFKHAGGEIIFSLPNGLQGYMLVAANGKRIDVAPVEIVSDIEQPDRNVVNGLSCMRCHSEGLIRKEDQVASSQNLSQFSSESRAAVESLYRSRKPEFKSIFEKDIARFQSSLGQLGINGAEPIREAVAVYNSPVSRSLLLSELGLTPDTLQDILNRLGSLKTQSPLRTRFEPLQRRAALGLKRPTVEANIKQIQQALIEDYIQMSLPSFLLEKLKPAPPKPLIYKQEQIREPEPSQEYTRFQTGGSERTTYSTTTTINGVIQERSSESVTITIYR